MSTNLKTRHCLNYQGQNCFQFRSEPRHSIPKNYFGSVPGQRDKNWRSFRARGHFRVNFGGQFGEGGDYFGGCTDSPQYLVGTINSTDKIS